MKNFTTFYSKIDQIVEARLSKKERGKGLLAPDKAPKTKMNKDQDVHEKIADYIEAIRRQKKGFLNED